MSLSIIGLLDMHKCFRFSIERYSSSYCNVKTNTGEYSCLTVDLVFKRQFSYYLITIYVPGCMLVIVSWVNFWLDPKVNRE